MGRGVKPVNPAGVDVPLALQSPAWIGRVRFSKSGQSIYYRGRHLQRIKGGGIQGNYIDAKTGEEYWVSGIRKDGEDRHYTASGHVHIDEDVREEYSALLGHRVRGD